MKRRFAEYRPAARRRAWLADVRLFRSVRLNPAGWAGVVALCAGGAAVGYAAGGRLLRLPGRPAALGGALTVLGCLVVLDRRQHARLARPGGFRM
jgi:hypothetical protein